jgi:hypothetical protein
METFWTMARINPAGGYRIVQFPQLLLYIQQQFGDRISVDRDLFRQLMQAYKAGVSDAELALRCYLSHVILQECKVLVQQFGATHHFSLDDILPIVLDDVGQLKLPEQVIPNSLKILQKYDPETALLATWASRLTRQNRQLTYYLKTEYRLLLMTDWALLNDTKPQHLRRILIQFFNTVEAAATQLACLHEAYRFVYLPSRAQQGSQRCLPPSVEQLQAIAAYLHEKSNTLMSPEEILEQLQVIASYIRRYRLQDFPLSAPEPVAADPIDSNLYRAYEQQFLGCLDWAIKTVIALRQEKQPKKAERFLEALRLLFCENQSQGQIADHYQVNQSTIARLLKLADLRRDIRLHMIPCLQNYMESLTETQTVPQKLLDLDAQLTRLLEQDQIEQATGLSRRRDRSLLSQRICRMVDSK